MQERQVSGQNIREYCETHGIHENVYYYWQRKLRCAAVEKLSFPQVTAPQAAKKTLTVPNGWAVCEELSSETTDAKQTLTIEIGGFRVPITADTDPELLKKICGVLKSLC
jgi:transposase-like protein